MDDYEYKYDWMSSGLINPMRFANIIPMTEYNCFQRVGISEYLKIRRNKLITKFYSRRIFMNKCIKTALILIPCLILLASEFYGLYILSQSVNLSDANGSWLGLIVGMSVILLGLLIEGAIDNYFPISSLFIDINKRK